MGRWPCICVVETARRLLYACGKEFSYQIGDSLPVGGRMVAGVLAAAAAAAREYSVAAQRVNLDKITLLEVAFSLCYKTISSDNPTLPFLLDASH